MSSDVQRYVFKAAGLAAALAMLAAVAPGCSEVSRKEVRSWTYPPDFNYISSRELRSIMSEIAGQIAALNAVLRSNPPADAATRAEVVQRLQAMDTAAQRLGPEGWPSNHPRITDNAQRFQRDIRLALLAAQREPPQYFLAGTLSGSCSICHGAD